MPERKKPSSPSIGQRHKKITMFLLSYSSKFLLFSLQRYTVCSIYQNTEAKNRQKAIYTRQKSLEKRWISCNCLIAYLSVEIRHYHKAYRLICTSLIPTNSGISDIIMQNEQEASGFPHNHKTLKNTFFPFWKSTLYKSENKTPKGFFGTAFGKILSPFYFRLKGVSFSADYRDISGNVFMPKIFVPLRTENKTELCWKNWRQ